MIDDSGKKVSADRLHRFMDQDRERCADRIALGDIIVLKNSLNRETIGQVLGFKMPGQKSVYKGLSCGIETKDEVLILVNAFKIQNDKLVSTNKSAFYISNENYVKHVKFHRNVRTNEISIVH